jgi:hypothetical protein
MELTSHDGWRLEAREAGSMTRVTFAGQGPLDAAGLRSVRDDLGRLVAGRTGLSVFLDLPHSDWATPAAVDTILAFGRVLHDTGGRLAVTGPAAVGEALASARTDAPVWFILAADHGLNHSGLAAAADDQPLQGKLTADDIRHLDEQGLSLADVIRGLEPAGA